MVKRKKLRRFFRKQSSALIKNLDKFCKKRDKDSLHNLRLDFKKIKAIVKLVKECQLKFKLKIGFLREIFKHAGEVRTAQLHIDSLLKHKIENEAILIEQEAIIKDETELICEEKKKIKTRVKAINKNFRKKIVPLKDKSVANYYKNNLQKLKSNFEEPVDVNILHDCRKIIKNLLYPLKLMPHSLLAVLQINEQYLDELQDLIGNWHDADLTITLLQNKNLTTSKTYESLQIERQDFYNKIVLSVKDFDDKVRAQKAVAEDATVEIIVP